MVSLLKCSIVIQTGVPRYLVKSNLKSAICAFSGLSLMVWTTQAVLTCTLYIPGPWIEMFLHALVTFTGILSVIRSFHSFTHSFTAVFRYTAHGTSLFLLLCRKWGACESANRLIWMCGQRFVSLWIKLTLTPVFTVLSFSKSVTLKYFWLCSNGQQKTWEKVTREKKK